ncbi:MAG: tyrosine-type recombinase/integrase [Bacillota bacterium]|jgi:integrase/recombinase XerD
MRRARLLKNTEKEEPKKLTWETAFNRFIFCCQSRNLSAYSIRHLTICYKRLMLALENLGIAKTPDKFTEEDFRRVIIELRDGVNGKGEKGSSLTTVNHIIRATKQLFSFMASEGMIARNPLEKVRKVKAEQKIIESYTNTELERFFKACDRTTFTGYRDYLMLRLLLDTGIRLSELCNIELDDLVLNENKLKVFGKGAKERVVFYSDQTKHVIQRWLEIRGSVPGENHLLVTNNNAPMQPRTVQGRIWVLGEKAGISGKRVSPHTFRHTFARLYLLNGGDIISLQKLLGHSTMEMVRRYIYLWDSDLQAQYRKFCPTKYIG